MIKAIRIAKTGIACGLLLLTGGVTAVGSTITVTTDQDENGSNASACSLREALYVVNSKSKAPWGGCPAGAPVGDNIIQLEAKTYVLTAGELTVLSDVIIRGADTIVAKDDAATTNVDETLNPYTGLAPNRKPPVTIIDAANSSRIISSLGATGSSLQLKDIELRNGKASPASNQGNGGAIYAALSVSLDNVVIRNSKAQVFMDAGVPRGGMGGAIFLSKNNTSLSSTDTSLIANSAEATGGVLAMVCDEDLSLASHTISITRSLLAANTAVAGAGAIEACGLTSITMTASTLSANQSLASSAALNYQQTVSGQGSVSINSVTAAQQTGGAVFAFKGLGTVGLNNSFLIGNVPLAGGMGGNCKLDAALSFPSGSYNSIDDASCDALLLLGAGGANLKPGSGLFATELLPLALKGGLTQVYMLASGSQWALNKGADGESCTGTDQRNLSRKNGAKCDIGAVERMEPTAVDDDVRNGTDSRVIIADVLANDSFGEDDSGPNHYPEPGTGPLQGDAVKVTSTGGTVTPPGGTAQPVCSWHDKNDANEKYRNKLVIDNLGVITPENAPISCTYEVQVVSGGVLVTSSTVATVKATVSNIAPVAFNDFYVRPLGVLQVTLDILANDTDADDAAPFQSGHDYIVSISTMPVLGRIDGRTGYCPGSTATSPSPKICYARDLTYTASNPQSPFTDYIQYSVYDDDGSASGTATVTIKTNSPDPDKGQTGGSIDWAVAFILALLGLRRARKL